MQHLGNLRLLNLKIHKAMKTTEEQKEQVSYHAAKIAQVNKPSQVLILIHNAHTSNACVCLCTSCSWMNIKILIGMQRVGIKKLFVTTEEGWFFHLNLIPSLLMKLYTQLTCHR